MEMCSFEAQRLRKRLAANKGRNFLNSIHWANHLREATQHMFVFHFCVGNGKSCPPGQDPLSYAKIFRPLPVCSASKLPLVQPQRSTALPGDFVKGTAANLLKKATIHKKDRKTCGMNKKEKKRERERGEKKHR